MLKLKEIISQLDANVYEGFEKQLTKTKADNFLFLTQSYRNGNIADEEIIKHLNINSNSFYALKSRLLDKVKTHISGAIDITKDDVNKQLQQVHNMCYNQPREIAIAFLQKLEADLLKFDMHIELISVYSALKKIHLQSEHYFHYSQLYNKQVAFWLSLEKTEAILGNFNQILTEYECSKAALTLDKLLFLRQEVLNHLALNPSRQIEIIKNIVDIQLCLFCEPQILRDFDIENVLRETSEKVTELPDSSLHKKWEITIDFLFFEYYKKNNNAKALPYYQKLNDQLENLLLYNNVCLTPRFLLSKIQFQLERNELNEFLKDADRSLLIDVNDGYSKVIFNIYRSMLLYYSNKTKEAIALLNDTINQFSFKDFFHINIEIKMTLAFFYIQLKEMDLAENQLKSIYRKIKSEELDQYANVLDLVKAFNLEISGDKNNSKKKDSLALFMSRNTGQSTILTYLLPELKKKFS